MRLLAALLVFALLPAGQALSLEAQAPELMDLEPLVSHDLEMDVTIRCETTDAVANPGRVLVHEITASDDGIVLQAAKETALPDTLCRSEQETTVTVAYGIVADRMVQGLVPHALEHTFRVEAAGAPLEEAIVSQTIHFGWMEDFTATADERLKMAAPQKMIPYDITVTNHGNSRTMYRFEVVEAPSMGQVVVPDQLILDPAAMGPDARTTAVATLHYVTPFQNGPNNEEEGFTIRVIPVNVDDAAQEGEPVELSFVGRTKGVYVPGPTGLLPVALLGAALLRRRA